MPPEPSSKRAIAFIDGQNLFYAVKHAFGYTFPNYDASALADAVCRDSGWTLSKVHFYTGIPIPSPYIWFGRCCTNSYGPQSLISQRHEDEDSISHPQLAAI